MYSQNNVWLEKKNAVKFHVVTVGCGKDKMVLRIEDEKYDGHLSLHMDTAIVPELIERLQTVKVEEGDERAQVNKDP